MRYAVVREKAPSNSAAYVPDLPGLFVHPQHSVLSTSERPMPPAISSFLLVPYAMSHMRYTLDQQRGF